ncbi:MAG: hypothetical protein WEA58_06595 [Balneolaceae bacterium]
MLYRSNNGETWERITILGNEEGTVEATVYDVTISSQNPEHVLAGLGIIRKSTNNGETWTTVYNEAGIYTFTRSAGNPEVVYGSGENANGRLVFVASNDFGDTWEMVEFEENVSTGLRVNDMVSVLQDGEEVLYFATNKGLYSYRFER